MDLPEGYITYVQNLQTNGNMNSILVSSGTKIQEIKEATHCCELKKAIYGSVQAAHQWWKKFKTVILQVGYKPSLADPCLPLKMVKLNHSLLFM
jgi:hypothetical protein